MSTNKTVVTTISIESRIKPSGWVIKLSDGEPTDSISYSGTHMCASEALRDEIKDDCGNPKPICHVVGFS